MKMPTPPPGIDQPTSGYLYELVNVLTKAFAEKQSRNTAQPSVLLASPNGSVYTVTVTDAGVITSTLVYDAS
jgi:hypothetical protein